MMSRRGIDGLGRPDDRYRVDRCPGFESLDACFREDLFRGQTLLKAAGTFPEVVDQTFAVTFVEELVEALKERKSLKSLGCSTYMRDVRINVCGEIWRLLESYSDGDCDKHVRSFTIVPRSWEFKAGELADVDPRSLIKALRTALYEQGAAEKNGWIIAFIHGEYDPVAMVYRLHVHGLAVGGMVQVIDRLRNLPNYQTQKLDKDGKPNPVYRRVRINRKPLNNLPDPITYLVQSFWPSRAIVISDDGQRIRARQK